MKKVQHKENMNSERKRTKMLRLPFSEEGNKSD